MESPKKTKIIATIGPSSWEPEMLRKLYEAGVNAARVNASFADFVEMERVLRVVRDISEDFTAILDLKGHKIRINDVGKDGIEITDGQEVVIGTDENTKSPQGIYLSYSDLGKDIETGARILIDDGKIELEAVRIENGDIFCKVIVGGLLKRLKTVITPGTKLTFPPLTEKDEADLKKAVELGFDYVAASFVRDVEDVRAVKEHTVGSHTKVIVKIEDAQGVKNFDSILQETDAVMIARGDMGVELPFEQVPALQREMIQKCREYAKPVIVATHMLESMIENTKPTRAEANDVATAVFEGTDAVMLSGETSTGKYPLQAVEAMSRILAEAEKNTGEFKVHSRSHSTSALTDRVGESVAKYLEEGTKSKVLVLTKSGTTAKVIARYRLKQDVIALTESKDIARHLGLSYGVKYGVIDTFGGDRDKVVNGAVQRAVELGLIDKGDSIIVVSGSAVASQGEGGMIEFREA